MVELATLRGTPRTARKPILDRFCISVWTDSVLETAKKGLPGYRVTPQGCQIPHHMGKVKVGMGVFRAQHSQCPKSHSAGPQFPFPPARLRGVARDSPASPGHPCAPCYPWRVGSQQSRRGDQRPQGAHLTLAPPRQRAGRVGAGAKGGSAPTVSGVFGAGLLLRAGRLLRGRSCPSGPSESALAPGGRPASPRTPGGRTMLCCLLARASDLPGAKKDRRCDPVASLTFRGENPNPGRAGQRDPNFSAKGGKGRELEPGAPHVGKAESCRKEASWG